MVGVIVLGPEAQVIRTTLDEAQTADYAALLPGLADMARSMVREVDPLNDLEFFRLRGTRHEIMVAPSERIRERERCGRGAANPNLLISVLCVCA